MYTLQPINLELFALIMEAMGGIVVLLLGILGFFYLMDRKTTTKRIDKLEEFMTNQSAQFLRLAEQNNVQIRLMEVNQEHESKRLDMLQSMVQASATEDKIITKLLALQGK